MLAGADRASTRERTVHPLFNADQARRLLAAAVNLPDNSNAPLRGHTYRTMFSLLYGLGFRVGEVSRLRGRDVDFGRQLLVIRDTKFSKSRLLPFGPRIGQLLEGYIDRLTRFRIYKIVRRRARALEAAQTSAHCRRISPHVFRYTTAVHLLEAGVEVNVIRGWLGHVSLITTNRYAEISAKANEAALRACQPPVEVSSGFCRSAVRREDETLLNWLSSL
ncbi:MAG TPA: tyrosine-type recombinase/integrase [Candidatus Binataceae bacterium]|nr:tyrosine-type recombinase/integrase [Candidatus Binataceae bacterium]